MILAQRGSDSSQTFETHWEHLEIRSTTRCYAARRCVGAQPDPGVPIRASSAFIVVPPGTNGTGN